MLLIEVFIEGRVSAKFFINFFIDICEEFLVLFNGKNSSCFLNLRDLRHLIIIRVQRVQTKKLSLCALIASLLEC